MKGGCVIGPLPLKPDPSPVDEPVADAPLALEPLARLPAREPRSTGVYALSYASEWSPGSDE